MPVEQLSDRASERRLGLAEIWAVDAASLALDAPVQHLSGALRLEREGARVRVTGDVEAEAVRRCSRCDEPVRLRVLTSPELVFVPEAASGSHEEVELAEGDLDVGFYEGGELDLGAVLSEALALEMPSRVVCEDEAACEARTATLLAGVSARDASPFAALKTFRVNALPEN